MAKKQVQKTKKNEHEYILHTCGECGWGKFTYEMGNLDLAGKPICLECPHTEKRRRIRSERACDKWKPKRND